jgi:hypothetical protein
MIIQFALILRCENQKKYSLTRELTKALNGNGSDKQRIPQVVSCQMNPEV